MDTTTEEVGADGPAEALSETNKGGQKDAPEGQTHGWSEHKTKDSRTFWHHTATGRSTWEKPDDLKTDEELILSTQTSWREYSSGDARPYWFNSKTKESVWDMPHEVRLLKRQNEEKWPVFETKMEAREKLKILFERCNVPPRSKWDEGLRLITADRRYACFNILTTGEKKQCFTEYMNFIRKKAKDEERAARVKAREDMVKAVNNWEKMSPSARYADFAEEHCSLGWWHHLEERERDDIFQDCAEDFEATHRGDRPSSCMSQIVEKLMHHDTLSHEMSWQPALQLIREDPSFSEYDLLDLVSAWEEYVAKTATTARRKRRRAVQRTLRMRRDRLLDMFKKMADRGVPNLHDWGSLLEDGNLVDDERYLEVLGQSGSTPRELYEEFMDGLKAEGGVLA